MNSVCSGLPEDVFPAFVSPSVSMTEDGLILGSGSILVRMSKNGKAAAGLDLAADRDRFTALMAIVDGQTIKGDEFRHIEAADAFWRRGDKALANLRLIFADLPRLSTIADAYRLTLAEHLLDEGMAPDALMKELGFGLASEALKYAPGQARIPAGHGRESGQFTYGDSTGDRTLVASNSGLPEDERTIHLRESEGAATPEELAGHGHPITPTTSLPIGVGPGPYAGRSIPAGPGKRPSPSQQRQINEIGRESGCHTCGTKESGVPSGDFVGDHQPPKKLSVPEAPQLYFPQCWRCSNVQGGKVRHLPGKIAD